MSDLAVLLVDDDEGIRDVVGYSLRQAGFEVTTVARGDDALQQVQAGAYDLVVLDLMLPGLAGTEVCRRLREEGDIVPILMLTAKDAEVDRVLGLELGADDYLVKPFSGVELVSRVRAILRRREYERRASREPVRQVGALRIDLERHRVEVDGEPVPLTPSELKLLALLAAEPERVFSRREIMEHLWESTYVGDQHACDVHVSNLRRKIEDDPANPARLVNVRGAGYKLVR